MLNECYRTEHVDTGKSVQSGKEDKKDRRKRGRE
jgi:hypothetical protein